MSLRTAVRAKLLKRIVEAFERLFHVGLFINKPACGRFALTMDNERLSVRVGEFSEWSCVEHRISRLSLYSFQNHSRRSTYAIINNNKKKRSSLHTVKHVHEHKLSNEKKEEKKRRKQVNY